MSVKFGICVFFFMNMHFLSFGQNNADNIQIDNRLYDVYDAEYLNKLKKDNPVLLEKWNYSLDHAYYITEYTKDMGLADFPVVQIEDTNNINILLLEKEQNISKKWKGQTIYRINKTNNVLVLYPGEKMIKQFNEYRQKG